MAETSGWLLGRRGPRIVLAAVLFPLPLLAIVSAAIAAFTAITRGWRQAAGDSLAAAALLMALTALAGGFWREIGLGAAVTWTVAVLLGELLRRGSLNLAVQSCVLLGFVAALAFVAWSRDPQAYWEVVLRDLAERARSAGLEIGPADLLPTAAQVMTGVMAASAVASALGALFLGSWWAAAPPGRGFGAEFREVRMGRVLGVLAGVVALAALTGLRASVDDLLMVLATGFVVQGLAVVHWHGFRRQWPQAWPLALYLPLALVPSLAVMELVVLAMVGLVDNAYSLRRDGAKVV